MRVAQYALPHAAGDTQDAELVVYYFGGSGGTVEANIERWVGQMQQPDGRPSSAVAKRQSRTVNGLKVTLVDVPLVRSSTVAEVIAAWRRTRAPIVRPADPSTSLRAGGQRHGHPVIFDRSIFADLRSADPDTGAKAVFAIHRERIFNVDVTDPGAFHDIDTPEDYRKVLGS